MHRPVSGSRLRLSWGLLICAVALGGCARPTETPPSAVRRTDVYLRPETELISGLVPNRSTLADLLLSARLRPDLVPAIVALARTVFDPRRMKADHSFQLERTVEGLVRRFDYEIDEDRFLRILGPSNRQPEELTVELVPYEKTRTVVSVQGTISKESPSLFAAMEDAGERPDLSIELADIFGGELDFHADLQPGDSFRLTTEKVYREGKFSSYGPVAAAEFTNSGKVLTAVRFTVPGGKPAYYDDKGRSLKRFFLASPLKFAAPVSSRFSSARLHPVLRIVRPHLGVDYRAPSGSPVVAVANGTVLSAGWSGDAGRLVHVRHASGYETMYMHLSSIAVRAGQHVGQGELVGRVGMTGLATGPHLDYRVKRDGKFLNPLTVQRSLPPGEPIPAAYLAEFNAERDRVFTLLGHPPAAAVPVPSTAPPVAAPPAAPAAGPARVP
jgi:murein DD-endopeptidase MepM/ murein hydrolase activator NlpD